MGLKDYINALKEQNEKDVVFSKVPEQTIKVIPPEKETLRVLPPSNDKPKTTSIKLSLNKQESKPIKQSKKSKDEVTLKNALQLFKSSGTSEHKRDVWLSLYKKALLSKKTNSQALQMKKGRFMVTDEDNLLILPDFNVNQSTKSILSQNWLKNNKVK